MAGWNYEKSSFKRIYAYNDDLLTDDVDNMNLVMGTDNRALPHNGRLISLVALSSV